MSDAGRKNFEDFLRLASPNLHRECFAHAAFIYFRNDNAWVNLAASVVLTPFEKIPGHTGPRIVDLPDFRALSVVIAPDSVLPFLQGIYKGLVDPSHLPDGCEDSIQLPHYSFCSPVFLNRDKTEEFGIGFPAHLLRASGDSLSSLMPRHGWDEIVGALPSSKPPFSGFDGLARDLAIGSGLQHYHASHVSLVSPYWLKLQTVSARAADATIDAKVVSYWPGFQGKATLSLIPRSNEVRPNLAAAGIRFRPRRDGRNRYLSIVQTPGNSVTSVTSITHPTRRTETKTCGTLPEDGTVQVPSPVSSSAKCPIYKEFERYDGNDDTSPRLSTHPETRSAGDKNKTKPPTACRCCGGSSIQTRWLDG